MIEVIEQPKTKQCTCYQCKAVLEYTFLDIVKAKEFDLDGSEVVSRIKCPLCAYETRVQPYM